jgi:hypothetical protein
MGRLKAVYKGQAQTVFSPELWGDFPLDEILWDANIGFGFHDDFTAFGTFAAGAVGHWSGPWNGFGSTGATIVDADIVGGGITMGSDGDNEGASISTIAKPYQISADLGQLCFEARIQTSTIADTKHGIFVGLIDTAAMSATVPIAADGTLADENLVGFFRAEGDGDKISFVYKANGVTAVTLIDALVVPVANTFLNLGFRFDPHDGNKLKVFVDNVKHATTKVIPDDSGSDFPADVRMGMVAAVLNATASTPGTSTADSMGCYQLRT